MGGWWRWALVSLTGVAPSRMVGVSASVEVGTVPSRLFCLNILICVFSIILQAVSVNLRELFYAKFNENFYQTFHTGEYLYVDLKRF